MDKKIFSDTITMEDLGYNDFVAANIVNTQLDKFVVARVIAEHKGSYRIKNNTGEYLARVTGRQIFKALSRSDYPVVGDWVVVNVADKEHAVIQNILPRQSVIKRKYSGKNESQIIATNIDVALVVEAVDRDYNLNRIERYFAIAEDGRVKLAIILNKVDLITMEERSNKVAQLKMRFSGIDIIETSSIKDDGLAALKDYLAKGKTYCFLGSSGVGKSSLINKLLGENRLKTGDISTYSGRGRHITSGRQMYFLGNGAIVIDNPGMREVGMVDVGGGINAFFEEIANLALTCRYTNCMHTHEPGCAVLRAVELGRISREKYANYLTLKKEAQYYEMNELEKREKDRQFGKMLQRYHKTSKKKL